MLDWDGPFRIFQRFGNDPFEHRPIRFDLGTAPLVPLLLLLVIFGIAAIAWLDHSSIPKPGGQLQQQASAHHAVDR